MAWPDGTAFCTGPDHFDGFQSDGGHNITIRHNTIRNPVRPDERHPDVHQHVGDPRCHGSRTTCWRGGGYSLYCNAGPDVPNETVTGNRFSKRWFRDSAATGARRTGCEDADVFSGNVWDETGAAL